MNLNAMPRPRDSASAEFNALKKELAKLVMEEQMRYTETEIQRLYHRLAPLSCLCT